MAIGASLSSILARNALGSNAIFAFTFPGVLARSGNARALQRAFLSTQPVDLKDSNEALAREALKNADAVCFDVDSTVIREEGIDVLADFCGAGEQVAELTRKAMGGSMLFQDAIKARLDLIQPSRQDITNCLDKHPPPLSAGVKEFIKILHERGTDVYLVSGGFRLMIQPVADLVGVPHSRIYANTILFNENGTYRDFDTTEPTSHSGGKAEVIKLLQDKHGYKNVIMVGDGVTDMQARPPAAAFIGYGGVAEREAVMEGADWFVRDFADLITAVREEGA